MQDIKGMTIYCDAEDYEIVPGLSSFQIQCKGRVVANRETMAGAQAFVNRRCNPKEIRGQHYDGNCSCGNGSRGWDYFSTGGLVYERCNQCNKPLRMIAVKLLAEDLLKDFDLEDFIND